MTTISVLSSELRGWNGNSFFWGITRRAREEAVDILWYPGGRLEQAERGLGNLYQLAGQVTTDGYIMVGDLAMGSQSETIKKFCESYAHVPVVGGIIDAQGVPVVLPDSQGGMYKLVSHLIEVHRFRRIAFVCGPSGQLESRERLQAYEKALKDHGLDLDPDLVAPGDYLEESGRSAIRLLIDERRIRPEAIVAANDAMALGALTEFRSRGIRVPDDIALAGFDDIEAGRLALTPLTTVRQRFYEAGYRTADTVLERIKGAVVQSPILVPTEVVIRSSCGCMPAEVEDVQYEEAPETEVPVEEIRGRANRLVDAMLRAALAAGRSSHSNAFGVPPQIPSQQTLLEVTEALFEELFDSNLNRFLSVFRHAVQPQRAEVEETATWQDALSALRSGLLSQLGDRHLAIRAENLFQKARVLLAETGFRVLTSRRTQIEQIEGSLLQLDQSLNALLEIGELPDILTQHLPSLGIPSCYIVLYEGAGHIDGAATLPSGFTLVFAYGAGKPQRFESPLHQPGDIIPAVLKACTRPAILLVEPLFQGVRPLGFMILEVSHSEFEVFARLRSLVSGALFRTLLLEQRETARRQLEELQAEAEKWTGLELMAALEEHRKL